MQDRMSEFKKDYDEDDDYDDNDAETGDEEDDEMTEFFGEVSYIKEQMSLIRKNIHAIEDCYNEQMWNSDDVGSNSSSRLEELLQSTNAAANDVRNRLKELAEENKDMGNDTNARTRKNMLAQLVKKFSALIEDYQQLQSGYKDKFRERIHRQARIASPDVTDAEVDTMIDQGEPQQMFADKILHDQRHNEAKNALIYIQEQHRDLMQLERSINELHQVFVDMQTITQLQGELMDQIDHNIQVAQEHTSKATEMLQKAESHKIASRKKCCIIIIIIVCCTILILLIIGAVIALVVGIMFAGG